MEIEKGSEQTKEIPDPKSLEKDPKPPCPHAIPTNIMPFINKQNVYKDQCTKCFAEYQDPAGIDCCFKCLNGGCVGLHSENHFKLKNHPLVLNLKATKKIKKGGKVKKITKLGIGIEGGAKMDKIEWDIKT